MSNRIQRFLTERLLGFSREQPPKAKQQKQPSFVPLTAMSGVTGHEPAQQSSSQYPTYYESWAYACIATIASETAKIRLKLYERSPKGEIQEVPKHEALDLLHTVNAQITMYDLFEMTQTYKDIYGEAFWWLVRDQGKKSINSIFPWLNPSRMDLRFMDDGSGQIDHYEYHVPGTSDILTLDAADVLHFKYFNPTNSWRGMSPIQAARFSLATDREAAAWNWRFFKNEAKPSGIITYDFDLPDAQIERIKSQWDNSHRGTDNAHKIAILTGKAKYQDVGFSQKDMDFLEQRRYARDEILTIFRVPLAVLNPDESINRATAEAANAVFFERVVEPKMLQIINTLNEFFLKQFDATGKYFFDYNNSSPRNLEADLLRYQNGIQNGWLTPNEVREENGRDPFDGGNAFYLPFNLAQIGNQQPKQASAKPAVAKLHTMGKPSLQEKIYPEALKTAKRIVSAKYREANVKTKDKVKQQEAIAEASKQPDLRRQIGEGFSQIKRARIDAEASTFQKLLKKQFERQKEQVLKTVRQKSAITKDYDFEFDEQSEADLFAEIFLPVVKDVVKAHGEDAYRLLGEQGFDINRAVREFLKRDGLKFAKGINETTKADIKKAIDAGFAQGEGIDAIKVRVSGVFEEASGYRARMIAHTEVNRSSNFGIEEGYRQLGNEEKEWYTPLNEDLEVCVPMDGVKIAIDDDFDLPDGQNIPRPPAHPNCNCTELPVIPGNKSFHGAPMQPVIIRVPIVDMEATERMEKVASEGAEVVDQLREIHKTLQDGN